MSSWMPPGAGFLYRGPQLQRGAGERAAARLLDDPGRSNEWIAEDAGCHRGTVARIRRELEDAQLIPVIRGRERTWRPTRYPDEILCPAPELPPMPESMMTGLCVTGGHDPDLWSSPQNDPAGRARAIRICRTPCPALADCAAWSLHLPATEKYAVYGGMSANERARRRRARRRQQAQASPAA
jgi:hypothetical protein